MPLTPYTVPAKPEVSYPEVRLAGITIDQPGVGRAVTVGCRIARYRVVDGVPEDAPSAADVYPSPLTLTVGELVADPALAGVVQTLTEYAVARAVADGLLTPAGG